MAGGASRHTTHATTGSGCDAESVIRAAGPLPSCPIGWRLRGISACPAASRPVSILPPAIPLSKRPRTAKIRRAPPSLHSAPVGPPATAQLVLLGEGWRHRRALFMGAHHPCLGSRRGLPYSARRGKKSVNRYPLHRVCGKKPGED